MTERAVPPRARSKAPGPAIERLVALAGNPNTGKTTLFNRLTGSRAKVGNYPGVTVERQVGELELPELGPVRLMDVPGTYSLSARSEEERLALVAVAGLHPLERPDAVVVVVDATQLTRNLYLALQVLELGLPTVIALNMVDRLEASGQRIDVAALSRELGVPAVPIVAQRGEGLAALRGAIADVLRDPARGQPAWKWKLETPALESDVDAVEREVPAAWHGDDARRRRALALWALLSVDDDELGSIPGALREAVRARRRAAEAAGRSLDEEIVRGRYDWIDRCATRFLHEIPQEGRSLTDRLDGVLLHPALGFVLFLTFMAVVFQSLFTWADPVIGLVERAVSAAADLSEDALPAGIFADLVANGLIQGVGSVLVFLPQILLLFFFIGLMEDTGYMARVAFLMDRLMKAIGLHGRAFVPMLSGYACAVPAILATRTMERHRDRLLTMMVIPLMTCSARLPVYGLLIAALYPPDDQRPFAQGLLMVAMYLFSTVVALVAAAVLGRTVLRGPRVPLLLEMPPYRRPHLGSVARMMLLRSRMFVREAGTVILACTIALWALLSFPHDPEIAARFAAERETAQAAAPSQPPGWLDGRLAELDAAEGGELLRQSYGGRLGHALEPVLRPLGFDWKIGVGLIGAFAAREVFISTMAVVYGIDEDSDETSSALRDRVRTQERADGSRVFTPLVCFSLMVFFALACQCMSTLAAVRRETASWRWPAFVFGYMTVLAWCASFLVYQGGQLIGFV